MRQRPPMLPARAEPAGLQPRAGTTALAGRVTEDDIWIRLTTPGTDVLYGLSFDQAVAGAPLLIEAVALQHIYGALRAAGAPMDLNMGREAWKARNDLVRRTHGGLRPMEIATSQELNWGLWGRTWVAAFQNAPAATRGFHAALPQLQAGFMAAVEVGQRAAAISMDDDEARQGWLRLAACFQAQAELLAHLMFAPVRGGGAGVAPPEAWPEPPAAPAAAVPRARRLEARGRALPGPVAVPEVRVAPPVAPAVEEARVPLDVAGWPDGWVVQVRPSEEPGRYEVGVQGPGGDMAVGLVEPATRSVHLMQATAPEAMGRLRFVLVQYLGFTRMSRSASAASAGASSVGGAALQARVPPSAWWHHTSTER